MGRSCFRAFRAWPGQRAHLHPAGGRGQHALVASEPGDDEPGWTQVSDQCVLTATPGGAEVRPLPVPGLESMPPANERMIT